MSKACTCSSVFMSVPGCVYARVCVCVSMCLCIRKPIPFAVGVKPNLSGILDFRIQAGGCHQGARVCIQISRLA